MLHGETHFLSRITMSKVKGIMHAFCHDGETMDGKHSPKQLVNAPREIHLKKIKQGSYKLDASELISIF